MSASTQLPNGAPDEPGVEAHRGRPGSSRARAMLIGLTALVSSVLCFLFDVIEAGAGPWTRRTSAVSS
jgi:hypothetical protein